MDQTKQLAKNQDLNAEATGKETAGTEAAVIEADEDDLPILVDENDDVESAYGTSIGSETTTLNSTIYEYVYENGRRYHRFQEGKYVLPNDETEQNRLDIYHHISLLLLKGRLNVAPLKNPQRILDIGTGTGVWAIDMAETYPEAEVIGTDLSPIQPSWVPSNCRFEVDDAELDWMFPLNHFDFIHSRTIAQSIRGWPKYLKQMYNHTKPGGYIELAEVAAEMHSDDGSYRQDSAFAKYINLFREASLRAGLRLIMSDSYAEMVKDVQNAGFIDVKAYKFKEPWGAWPKNPHLKNVGHCMAIQSEYALPAYGLALLTRYMDIPAKEASEICSNAYKDVKNIQVHMYNYVIHIVGRKPEGENAG